MDWERAQDLFDQAAALPKPERSAFLDKNCADPELRQVVLDLLAEADSQPADLISQIVTPDAVNIDRTGQLIGAYRIEREIGRGGMGEVFVATRIDKEFEHRVALKVVRRGLAIDEILGRFRQERQILARLDHANIVRLLDGGSTPDGLPYLAMDYVEGIPITEYCEKHKLDTKARVRLLLPVCDAVAHAHRHLVVHRDLKPANILVTEEGIPKLLDFGIAKLIETSEEATQTAFRPLTPDYASPEQVSGAPITTATDIYQTGAVLLRVVSGKKPNQIAGTKLPGELDNIIHRAMHADPERRYASAQELAEDLQRYLENRPVLARRDSLAYQLRKWVQRSPLTAAAIAAAVALALAAGTYAFIEGRRAERRFAQVRSLATTYIFEFDSKIKDLQGGLPARVFAVETAAKYLDSLSTEAANDVGLLSDLAAAYIMVARIEGDPSMANIGKTDQALADIDKALVSARKAYSLDPSSLPALRALINGLTFKGLLLAAPKQQLEKGLVLLKEAQGLAENLRSRGNLEVTDYRAIASANLRYADYLAPSAPKEAIRFYESAIQDLDRIVAATNDDQNRVARVAAFVGLSRAFRNLADPAGVVRTLEPAATALEAILAANPNSQGARRQLYVVWSELARALGNSEGFHMNRPRKALEVLEKARGLRQSQVEASASSLSAAQNIDILDAQASLLYERANALSLIDIQASLRDSEEGLAVGAKLKERDPNNPRYDQRLRNFETIRTKDFLLLGKAEPAIAILEGQITLLNGILAKNPKNLAALEGIITAQARLAYAYTLLKQFAKADTLFLEALARGESVLKQFPEDLYYLRCHATDQEMYGDSLRQQGKAAESLAQYRGSEATWARFKKISPTSTYPDLFLPHLRKKVADPKLSTPTPIQH
jgi:eukaryotic-like serine/threonine-protein kinase